MTDLDRPLDCLAEPEAADLCVHAATAAGLDGFLAGLPAPQAAFLRASGFTAAAGQVQLLPGAGGIEGAVLGLGGEPAGEGGAGAPAAAGRSLGPTIWGPQIWGALPAALPPGTRWRLSPSIMWPDDAVLGWCMGAYRFDAVRSTPKPAPPRLAIGAGAAPAARSAARAIWLVRDLINLPANLLGPETLAAAAAAVLRARGATVEVVAGPALDDAYPAIAAVGRGSSRPPHVAIGRWQGSAAGPEAPLVSLCGKGVCFDTGGYDLKPAAGMLRMKKDMGGAAIALGLAAMIIEADLPVRLAVRLGCVENAVGGDAMRPLDVIATRRGLRVEVGNTDAEGRLVLCDLLAEAADETPDLLLDFATLTGAARVALGPDLPAMFSNSDAAADAVLAAGTFVHDSVYRLPLWKEYDSWLASNVADLNNVSEKSFAGAIVAALFLQRFVPAACRWIHFDMYAWNDRSRPGRPEGGEAQAMRAAFAGVSRMFAEVPSTGPRGSTVS